jgi:hypothetical protein
MNDKRGPGPCPFLGNLDHVPAGPEGTDVEEYPLETTAGTIRLKAGDVIYQDGSKTVLRKVRRCTNGEIYGMVEYPDGGLLWTGLAPAPVPELTEWQKTQLKEAEKKIPRRFQLQGDWANKVGDRVSRGGDRMGTIVMMATPRSCFTAGAIVAMDDGSMSVGDDAMALMDERIAHASIER